MRIWVLGVTALLAGCAERAGDRVPIAAAAAEARAVDAVPDATIRYGAVASQRIELFLPAGRGPHPVVAFIHGGCYRASVAGLEDMRPVYAALARRGVAVWGVGYRRAEEGAFPAMYADVATAIDRLRAEAPARRLDLARFVVAGHSAGGHLALWAAGRHRLPRGGAAWSADPLRPRGVVAVAGPGDIEALAPVFDSFCGPGVLKAVVGTASATRTNLYADISPVELVPLGVPTTLVVGERDDVVPARLVTAYGARARAAGDMVTTRVLPGVDHMQVVTPGQSAFDVVADAILAAADRGR